VKNWRMTDIAWDRFDPARVSAVLVPLVKAAALVERNAADYAAYLANVFRDDPEFRAAAEAWSIEEVQHGDALGRWGMLADPGWDFQAAFARFREGYRIPIECDASVRGSRTGELIARCIVETGTSSYYTALGERADEPVLQQICRYIAADELRHFKLFYTHMREYLKRENISLPRRVRIGLGRITESEDDELAFAFHCANDPADAPYDHARSLAAYMGGAVTVYRYRHVERAMAMAFKAVGLPPRGRLSDLSAWAAWKLVKHRRRRIAARAGLAAA
jgi:rubrerythrin